MILTEPVLIALISALGLVTSGVLVELVRTRRQQDRVVQAVTPNHGTSLRDAVDRIERTVSDLTTAQQRNSERLAVVEALMTTSTRESN